MNSLVIVTCSKDYWKFEMLCRSIQKFLKPANITIVINEDDNFVDVWNFFYEHVCKPLLAKHKVQLYKRSDFYNFKIGWNHFDGWVHQQIIKMLVARTIKDTEYLILDSKNFFFRHTDVESVKQTEPTTGWMLPPVERFCIETCKYFKFNYSGRDNFPVTQNITPYVIQTDVAIEMLEYFGSDKRFYDWFQTLAYTDGVGPTEFIAYEVFSKKIDKIKNHGLTVQNSATMWEHNLKALPTYKGLYKEVLRNASEYDIKVSGFHSTLHNLLTQEQVEYTAKNLGLNSVLPKFAKSPFR